MVESISSNGKSIQDLQLAQINQALQTGNPDQASGTNNSALSGALSFLDKADLSKEAFEKLQSEREVSNFATLAFRQDEPVDTSKVDYIKNLVQSGKYFNNVSNDDLAASLLGGPGIQSFLQQ